MHSEGHTVQNVQNNVMTLFLWDQTHLLCVCWSQSSVS